MYIHCFTRTNFHRTAPHRTVNLPCNMPGGSSSKQPHSSFSAHHRKSRWESSSSSVAAFADRKASTVPKSKPSPNLTDADADAYADACADACADAAADDCADACADAAADAYADAAADAYADACADAAADAYADSCADAAADAYADACADAAADAYADSCADAYADACADAAADAYADSCADAASDAYASSPSSKDANSTIQPNSPFPGRKTHLQGPIIRTLYQGKGSNAWARVPEFWNPGPESSLKHKLGEDKRGATDDGFKRQRQQLLQYGNVNGPGPSSGYNFGRGEEMRASKNPTLEGHASKLKHSEVDQNALKKAFFHFLKLIFETSSQKKNYLGDGKQGSLRCLTCSRDSKDFADMHSLIMHAYNSDMAESIVDHLAFHKALCILMGWNYLMPPDNSKAYQKLSSDDAEANQDDLIMWPPSVLIHNTITGKGRDGRLEGLGNKAMNSILRDLGFPSKSMSMHSREGHLGIHAIKFPGDESGLKEALRLAEYFIKEKHGRKAWAHVKPSITLGKDDENNPNLVKPDSRSGEKRRVLYGHLATVADLDKVTFEIKKKVTIVSRREFKQSK